MKPAREKQLVTYKGTPVRLTADFSTETEEIEGGGTTCSKCSKKEKTISQESYIQQSYFSKLRWNKDIYRYAEAERIVAGRLILQEILKEAL